MKPRWIILAVFGLLLVACSGGRTLSTTTTELTSTSTTTTTLPPTTTTTTTPRATLTGRVVDSNGTPVSGALVSVPDEEVFADENGEFSFGTTFPALVTVVKPGWTRFETNWDGTSILSAVVDPMRIRGLRVSPEAASDDASFALLLELADNSAVNALVFDTKQEGGRVLYETSVADAHAIGAVEPFYSPAKRIGQAHDHGLYAITRLVVFEDSIRVKARPEEKLAGAWIDPRSQSAWRYNIDLATEACEVGFDEIQFDYVRFPAGTTAQVSGQLDLTADERVATIEGFLKAAREVLIPIGCAVSADIFGIVVSVADDQGLGQRPEELSRQLDAVSPMVYPSHYSLGWLGFPDPNDHPYDVTADAIDDGLPRLAAGAVLRPWLQAFWWTNAQIRSSIQAAEDRGVGWILWNVRSNFDLEALPSEDEVEG